MGLPPDLLPHFARIVAESPLFPFGGSSKMTRPAQIAAVTGRRTRPTRPGAGRIVC